MYGSSLFSDPSPFAEHYRRCYLRGEIDLDIAVAQFSAYADRATAVRPKRLADVPRPAPIKASLATPRRRQEVG